MSEITEQTSQTEQDPMPAEQPPTIQQEAVVPPTVTPPPPTPKNPRRWNAWLYALLAVVLIAASSGITYLAVSNTSEPPVADQSQTATTAAPSSNAPVVLGEEPVADAAEVILPSVVQIQVQNQFGQEGVGSGVIYDANGLILTAAHVVESQSTVTVRFQDGEEVQGTVLGGTSDADVAVVKVDRTGLPAAQLALNETPRVGQMAIAVGSPWALQGTVTAGIVSAVDQPVTNAQGAYRAMLQTDAAINPGNSGGALVDRQGRVLGINVSIFSTSGANDGVGFAVPIDTAYSIAQKVVAGEPIGIAFLGVTPSDTDSGQAGAQIADVVSGSAAEAAGIQVGDLIVELGGVQIQGAADLAAQVRRYQPGDQVDVVLVRNGQQMTITATLGEAQG